MSEFQWHPSIITPGNMCRRITQDPYAEAVVYKNAHDQKTFVALIENHGSMGSYGVWPFVSKIKFGFKRRRDAMAWADREIPKVRKLLRDAGRKP